MRILLLQHGRQIGLFVICKAKLGRVHGELHVVQRHLQRILFRGLLQELYGFLRRPAGQVGPVQRGTGQKGAQGRGLRIRRHPFTAANRCRHRKQQGRRRQIFANCLSSGHLASSSMNLGKL